VDESLMVTETVGEFTSVMFSISLVYFGC